VLSTEPPSLPSPQPTGKLHLAYLDGIRGLAALYVVLVHCWHPDLADRLQPPWLWLSIDKLLRYGIFAVVIFIVLSGYCLMLPVVRSAEKKIAGGLREFYRRRIRRILPPYFAALLVCVVISGFTFWVEAIFPWRWNPANAATVSGLFSPYFSWRDVVPYVLLIQNFGFEQETIIGPSWTIAVEWQIYFVFAVLLVPLWRRYGWFATIVMAFLLGVLPLYLARPIFESARFWFLGLFALGMLAADISFSTRWGKLRRSLPWMGMAIGLSGLAFVLEWLRFRVYLDLWVVHTFLALGTACFLVGCTRSLTEKRTPFRKALPTNWALRFLESRRVVELGTLSYSLYLIHAPVVFIVHQVLASLSLAPSIFAFLFLSLGVSLSLGVASVFHRVFERPYMANFATNLRS
jgi:peptidoglycan/LPS O-acetylase OafA/YrhL